MKNKTLAQGLIAIMAGAILTVILEGSISASAQNSFTMIIGLAFYFFGIYAAVRLLKLKDIGSSDSCCSQQKEEFKPEEKKEEEV